MDPCGHPALYPSMCQNNLLNLKFHGVPTFVYINVPFYILTAWLKMLGAPFFSQEKSNFQYFSDKFCMPLEDVKNCLNLNISENN